MFYQTIEREKREFLSEYSTVNPILRTYSGGIFINDRIIVDKENETLTIFQNKEYLGMFEGRVGGDSYNLTFQKYITDQIWKEYSALIYEIDESYWKQKKEEFNDFLEKIKVEVNFIVTKANQYYLDYCTEDNFSESLSFEGIINHTNAMLASVLEHLENKYKVKISEDLNIEHTKINTSKKQWLKLIREAKIDELFKELFELENIKEDIDITIHSSRWNILRQDMSKGILDRDKYDIEFSKIIKSLAEFVKNLE